MRTSPTTGEVLSALLRAKAQFKPIAKTKHARIKSRTGSSFDFWYAPLEVIQAATEPALMAEGLLIVSGMLAGPDGAPAIVTRLMHATSQQWLESVFPSASLVLEDLKAMGGLVTYGRRYNLLALLDLVGEDDVDASLADGDATETHTKAVATSATHGSSNGHTPAPEGDAALEHPTEAHLAALRKLAVTVCMDEPEVFEDRLRRAMGVPKQASVSPRLLVKTMSMAAYMEVYAWYINLESQLAKAQQRPEASPHGTQPASTQSPEATAAPAPTGETPAVPSPAASSSAAPDTDEAADRERLVQEAIDAGIAEQEARHIVKHHELKAAQGLLLAAAKKRLQQVA